MHEINNSVHCYQGAIKISNAETAQERKENTLNNQPQIQHTKNNETQRK
jgi:hypothetical protein